MTDGQIFVFAGIAALLLAAILEQLWLWSLERRFPPQESVNMLWATAEHPYDWAAEDDFVWYCDGTCRPENEITVELFAGRPITLMGECQGHTDSEF